MAELNLSDDEIDGILGRIHSGELGVFKLPTNLYNSIADRILSGVFKGFGNKITDLEFGGVERNTLAAFQNNVYAFSGAKTFQQVKDMGAQVFDNEGFKKSFTDFKADARGIFDTYNERWLKVEHRTAVNQAISGRQWLDIQDTKDALPLLEYLTVGDERVRATHVPLDGIVKPVGDPFWRRYFPPNDWNCRCDVLQHEEGDKKITDISDKKLDTPPKLFDMNAGTDKLIFKPSHPYFKVEDRFQVLKGNNFGLPIPAIPNVKTTTPKTTRKVNRPKSTSVTPPDAATSSLTNVDIRRNIVKWRTGEQSSLGVLNKLEFDTIKKTITDLNKKYAKFNPINVVRGVSKDKSKAYYMRIGEKNRPKTININIKYFRDNNLRARAQKQKYSFSSKVNPEKELQATITHEYGHGMHATIKQTDAIKHKKISKLYNGFTKKEIKSLLSEYAATNEKEFFAESFAALNMGVKNKITMSINKLL